MLCYISGDDILDLAVIIPNYKHGSISNVALDLPDMKPDKM